MAHIVVLGGGIGGVSSAYDLKQAIRREDRITLVSNKPFFQFTPSNPWVAVKWRTKNDITIDLASVLPKHGVAFSAAGAARVHADSNRVELGDGTFLDYDYLVIATGPSSPSMRSKDWARKRTVTPSAMWTTPRAPTHDGRSFAKIPVQSWSAPCKEPRVTAQPTNSR